MQQLAVAVSGFIVPVFMLRYYGSEINGLVASINQFISYFRLVEAGLSGAAIYALYKPLAHNDHRGTNAILSAARIFYTKTGYIFLSLVIGLAVFYPLFISAESLTPFMVGLLVVVLGLGGAIDFFTLSKYRVLLSADQKSYVISLASIAHIFLNTVIIVVLSKLNANIVLLKTAALLSVFLRSFILMVYVRLKYRYVSYKEKPDYRALDQRWAALYLQVLGATQSGAPIILATIFATLKMVSVFSIYNMIITAVNGILGIFMSGLSASFGNIIALKEKKVLKKAFREFELLYYSIISVVYGIALVTLIPFVKIYTKGVTDENYVLPLLGFLFVLNGWLYIIKTPQGMMVMAAGLYKETRVQTTIQAAILVIFGVVLAAFFGLEGILIAACLSNLYRAVDLFFFIPKHVTGLPVKETLFRVAKMMAEIALICFPFRYLDLELGNYYEWLVYSVAVGIFGIMVVIFSGLLLQRDLFLSLVKRFKTLVSR